MTELDLHNGRVTDTGGLTLATFLSSNTTLRTLVLDRNPLRDCAAAFSNALRENHTLRRLSPGEPFRESRTPSGR